MKTTLRRTLKGLLCLAPVVLYLLAHWVWQANYAKDSMKIEVPQWIAGGVNVSYAILIGPGQIKPYGTVWKRTLIHADGGVYDLNFPLQSKETENYMKRLILELPPIEIPPSKEKESRNTVL